MLLGINEVGAAASTAEKIAAGESELAQHAKMVGMGLKTARRLIDGYFGVQGARAAKSELVAYAQDGNPAHIGRALGGGIMAAAATADALPVNARLELRDAVKEIRESQSRSLGDTRRPGSLLTFNEAEAARAQGANPANIVRQAEARTPQQPVSERAQQRARQRAIAEVARPKPPTPKPEDVIGRAFNVVKTGDLYSVVSDTGKAMLMTRDAAKAHDYANDLNKKSQASVGTSKRPTVNMEERRGAQAQSDAKPTPAPPAAATPQAWRPSPDRVYNVAKVGNEFRVMDDTGKFVVVKDKAGNVVKQSMSEKEAHAFADALNRNRGFELPKPTVKGKGPEFTENPQTTATPKATEPKAKTEAPKPQEAKAQTPAETPSPRPTAPRTEAQAPKTGKKAPAPKTPVKAAETPSPRPTAPRTEAQGPFTRTRTSTGHVTVQDASGKVIYEGTAEGANKFVREKSPSTKTSRAKNTVEDYEAGLRETWKKRLGEGHSGLRA